jgi:hypothetical protein
MKKSYSTLQQFYPFYLSQHQNFVCRVLHFIGTGLLLTSLLLGIIYSNWMFFALMPFIGYGFAWVGHFFFEHNKPATFQYPLFSLASDFILFWDLLVGKQKFKTETKL